MPAGDGTGPLGTGPKTGRAAGDCAGYDMPGYMNPIPGVHCNIGRGAFGRGRGHRHLYYATGLPYRARTGIRPNVFLSEVSPELELDDLKRRAKSLQQLLKNINKRIDKLDMKTEKGGVSE